MKRREFLKLSAKGVAVLSLPAALVAPARGGDWQEFDVVTAYPKRPASDIDLASYNLSIIARRMADNDLTEITGYSQKISWRGPGPMPWVVTAQAKLR